jgi:hypothetical protein
MRKQRIFDCFTFLNEFELLEIRLSHLIDEVDVFVIAQALHTHRGKAWTPLLNENSAIIQKFQKNAEFRFVVQSKPFDEVWEREKAQRAKIDTALSDLGVHDLIIVADLDEIPDLEQIKCAKQLKNVFHTLPMRNYFNFANTHSYGYWDHAKICSGRNYPGAQIMREMTLLPRIRPAGMHLSVIQGENRWIEKIGITPHTEMGEGMSIEMIRKCLALNLYPNRKIAKLWGGGKLKVNNTISKTSASRVIYEKFPEYFSKSSKPSLKNRIETIVELYFQGTQSNYNPVTSSYFKRRHFLYTGYCYAVYTSFFPSRLWSLVYRKAKVRTRLKKVTNYFR